MLKNPGASYKTGTLRVTNLIILPEGRGYLPPQPEPLPQSGRGEKEGSFLSPEFTSLCLTKKFTLILANCQAAGPK
jgi:hypothetical protein